jgi:phospholipid/cholesterol/gamma-HCH transport system substrate-binding protein
MKKNTTPFLKLGIFAAVGFLLLLIGVYYIGQNKKLFSTTFAIHTLYKNVDGLQVGNNIRYAGITVGTIEVIDIVNDTTVKVSMKIEEEVRQFIKKDAIVTIGSDGLMGNKVLNILPGTPSSSAVENDDVLASKMPLSMDDIMATLNKTAQNAEVISNDIAVITTNIRQGKGTIGRVLMDERTAKEIDKTITNVRKSAEGLSENMDALKENFLFKGYYKKKEKEKIKEQKQQEELEKREEEKK